MPIFVEDFPKENFQLKKKKKTNNAIFAGYWKATVPNKFIGRGTQVADFCRGFSKGIFPKCSDLFPEHVRKNNVENPLQKSATCVHLPINLFGPVAFQNSTKF